MKRKTPLWRLIRAIYQKVIVQKRDELNFWILIAFLGTFAVSRITVYTFPNLFLHVRGVHIHHFSYGIILLALSGILALNNFHHRHPIQAGMLYGIGLGLAMDEFGMWIRLDDDYWIRHSYDAVFITAAILTSIVYFSHFWTTLFVKISDIIKGVKTIDDDLELESDPKMN